MKSAETIVTAWIICRNCSQDEAALARMQVEFEYENRNMTADLNILVSGKICADSRLSRPIETHMWELFDMNRSSTEKPVRGVLLFMRKPIRQASQMLMSETVY
jgi:hypothetical protein